MQGLRKALWMEEEFGGVTPGSPKAWEGRNLVKFAQME